VDVVRADAEFTFFRDAVDGERIVVSALEAPIEGMRVRSSANTEESSSKVATMNDGGGE
jgi:hypothetical protein